MTDSDRAELRKGRALRGGEFATPGAGPHYAPDLPLEPTHLEIRARFDVPAKTAFATVTTTVVAKRDTARTLRLDAIELRDVSVVDPDGALLDWTYDGRVISVTWADPIPLGGSRRVAVTYSAVEPVDGMRFSGPDEAHPDRPVWIATDHETERARYWLPCVDHPTVRVPLDFHLTADVGFEILANGALISEKEHGDGTKTAHWRLEEPAPSYLTCIAIGDFVRVDAGEWRGRPIAFFAPRGTNPDDLRRSFGNTEPMLEWLSEYLGYEYPYPKYFQFAAPGIGGAMENISLVSWDQAWVMDEVAYSERGWLVELVNLHEMAHSWFGDLISCRDFAHTWLKESWATYMESCWLEDQGPVDEFHLQLMDEESAYLGEVATRYARPIVTRAFDSSWDMFDAHLYPGGAVRLHMLRKHMGDEAFWTGVREYVSTFAHRTVETSDFRRTMEKHGGLSLARFFDQWFRSPGHPKLKASMKYDGEAGRVTLTVEQTQVDEKAGIGLFDLPVTVAVETEEGTWLRLRVELHDVRHEAVIEVPCRPRQVVFDPDVEAVFTLDFDPGLDILTRELSHAPTVRGRIFAARRLGKGGSRGQVAALVKAYDSEPSWGVRVEIARALAKAAGPDAVAALADIVRTEEHPRAVYQVIAAAGAFRDPAIATAMQERIDRGAAYLAHGNALKALGNQRDAAPIDTLVAGTSKTLDWRVRRAAMPALAASRQAAALDTIREHLPYGADHDLVRAAAAVALADAARTQEPAVRDAAGETLVDLGRDPVVGVRMAVTTALQRLGDPRRVGAIEALLPRVSAQNGARVRRSMAALRKAGTKGSAITKLESRVEDLTRENRALRARIDAIEAKLDER